MGVINLPVYSNEASAIDGYNYLSNSYGYYGHLDDYFDIKYTIGVTGVSPVYLCFISDRNNFFSYFPPSYSGNLAHMLLFLSNKPFSANYYFNRSGEYMKSTTESQIYTIDGLNYNCISGFDGGTSTMHAVYNTDIYQTSAFMTVPLAVEATGVLPIPGTYPIAYRLTNATTTGPNEATVGDTVTVPLAFSEGYGVVNPSSDVYVTCNGVLVPSTYSNGILTFTMPDPS